MSENTMMARGTDQIGLPAFAGRLLPLEFLLTVPLRSPARRRPELLERLTARLADGVTPGSLNTARGIAISAAYREEERT